VRRNKADRSTDDDNIKRKIMQKEILEHGLNINRRRFLSRLSLGIGSAALGSLLIPDLFDSGGEEELALTGLPLKQKGLFTCFRMELHHN
jgi:hypothetical protein